MEMMNDTMLLNGILADKISLDCNLVFYPFEDGKTSNIGEVERKETYYHIRIDLVGQYGEIFDEDYVLEIGDVLQPRVIVRARNLFYRVGDFMIEIGKRNNDQIEFWVPATYVYRDSHKSNVAKNSPKSTPQQCSVR